MPTYQQSSGGISRPYHVFLFQPRLDMIRLVYLMPYQGRCCAVGFGKYLGLCRSGTVGRCGSDPLARGLVVSAP